MKGKTLIRARSLPLNYIRLGNLNSQSEYLTNKSFDMHNGITKHTRVSLFGPHRIFFKPFSTSSNNLFDKYDKFLKETNLQAYDSQVKLIAKLQVLHDEIIERSKAGESFNFSSTSVPISSKSEPATQKPLQSQSLSELQKKSWAFGFWNRPSTKEPVKPQSPPPKPKIQDQPSSKSLKGLYIWGGVGQGKTMIMDTFFETLEVEKKIRVHFHNFMFDIHKRLHALKSSNKNLEDPLIEIAKQIREEAQVLCFDEFQVVHITDAMILKRLFEGLFAFQTVIVSTSNRPPDELYKNGLNRVRFLPFIDLLKEKCEIYKIETNKDFRLEKRLSSTHGLYEVPSRPLEEILKNLKYISDREIIQDEEIQVSKNRTIKVPYSTSGIAVFNFTELCIQNVGTPDFLAIASNFHTIFIHSIPDLSDMDTLYNEIRRFINLIDVFYEKHIRVNFDVALPLFQLFGNSPTIAAYEKFTEKLESKFEFLQDFLDYCSNFSSSADKSSLTRDEFFECVKKTCALEDDVIYLVFDSLIASGKDKIPMVSIRSAIYFHRKFYSFVPPTMHDSFIFQQSDGKPVEINLQTVYKLNSGDDEFSQDIKFAFLRTLSRIRDMISASYLEAHQELYQLKDLYLLQGQS